MRRKGAQKSKLIDAPSESNKYKYYFWKTCHITKYIHSDTVFSMMNWQSASSQIVEQIGIVKEVALKFL